MGFVALALVFRPVLAFARSSLLTAATPVTGGNCSISKRFHVQHPQLLSGELRDPNGVVLPGIGVQLLSGAKVMRYAMTNNQGGYDLGVVPAGKYRIHIQYGDDAFCAPMVQCGNNRCRIGTKLQLNPKNSTVVR